MTWSDLAHRRGVGAGTVRGAEISKFNSRTCDASLRWKGCGIGTPTRFRECLSELATRAILWWGQA